MARPWPGQPRNPGSIPGSGLRFVSFPKCPDRLWGPVGTVGAGIRGNEIADKLARDGYVQRFVGPEPFLVVSRQTIRRKIKRWIKNQHLVLQSCPCRVQRQARELIPGPDLVTRARLLPLNRTHSWVIIGLLTGHNILRRLMFIGPCIILIVE